MAKLGTDIPFSGTYKGVTKVNSHSYGAHVRAARGSVTKAEVNDAMKEHGKRLVASNVPAKLIHDALQPFRTNFTGGLLWQYLVKHFAGQKKNGEAYSVDKMDIADINKSYPTRRLMYPFVELNIDTLSSTMQISINYTFSTRFLGRKRDIDGFQNTVIILFPDFINNTIITIPVPMPIKALADVSPHVFMQKIPPGASSYILCFKAEACVKGQVTTDSCNVDKAMRILKSGKIG